MTTNSTDFEEAIKSRFEQGFNEWNGGYEGWLNWCNTLYEPDQDVCSPRACPAASGPWGRPQPNTHTQPRRDPSPPPGLSARGHPRQGRLRRRPGRPG